MSNITIIGAGFSGISAAAFMAKAGHKVTVLEKNSSLGGRARTMSHNGFMFDMGPSWYWMPDVFDRFFEHFGHKTSDFYELKKLDPAFTMVFANEAPVHVPANYTELKDLFERLESGSGPKLDRFMKSAEMKYAIGMQDLVYKPGLSLMEFMNQKTLSGLMKLQVFTNFRTYVRNHFSDPRLISLMEFPVLFLGAMPQDTPALYSLMNYSGLVQGTFYPMGGFGKVIDGMAAVAKEQGVEFETNWPVEEITVQNNRIHELKGNNKMLRPDAVIATGDYHHMETLLDSSMRNYNEEYWNKKTFAPSSLLFYLGINTRVNKLQHHTLFFDSDLDAHAHEIYKTPKWPEDPLFYVCCPSKTDDSVAPAGMENLFLLMPIAPGLQDDETTREKYFNILMDRLETYTGQPLRQHVVYKRSYCVNDFKSDYNAYKGNAYGLANTLNQTAILKPRIKSKKVTNLFFAGQLTVPGPGVPPSIISGEVAAGLLNQQLKKTAQS